MPGAFFLACRPITFLGAHDKRTLRHQHQFHTIQSRCLHINRLQWGNRTADTGPPRRLDSQGLPNLDTAVVR